MECQESVYIVYVLFALKLLLTIKSKMYSSGKKNGFKDA